MDAARLADALSNFSGTEKYYRFTLFSNALLTDGTKYLADNGGGYWLMDVIASHQPVKAVRFLDIANPYEEFQVWKIRVNDDRSCVITCDDGNGNILVTQEIPFTDFLFSEYKLYCCKNDRTWVIMLPGEYY